MACCLQLISLSSRALDKADGSYDLVFDVSSRQLPAISTVKCWKGRFISPLRDRTMIEWLSSHREGEALLKEMTSLIEKSLRQKVASLKATDKDKQAAEAPSTNLLVAIACQNGAQHSVCFVEKLYEQYSYGSPLELEGDIRLEVKREHCVATKGEWMDVKDAVWQHSKIASKHLAGCKDLLQHKSWTSFPIDTTNQMEAAFRQDPFTMKLDVGKHVIDFERGTVFNKRSRDEFKVRAAIPRLEGKVKSSWLEDKGQKSFYCGAGILFYSVHPWTGEAVFLLGHMTYSSMSWCDFGGMKDHGL